MMRGLVLMLCAAAVSAVFVGVSAGANAPNAKICQKNGWKQQVGSNGTTFANEQACTSYGAKGGTYATGLILPAGKTATFTDAHLGFYGGQDHYDWGYQLNFGANVTLGTKLGGLEPGRIDGWGTPVPGTPATIGPYSTAVLLRVFLHDTGMPGFIACDLTNYSDNPAGALVVGSTSPWTILMSDGGACSGFITPVLYDGIDYTNFVVTLTFS